MSSLSSLFFKSKIFKQLKKHSHDEDFMLVWKMKLKILKKKKTWREISYTEVTNTDRMKALSTMMIFIYKFDQKEYLIKYKTRLITHDNLKRTEQDMYAIILTARIFRVLIKIVVVFDLEIRQFDVVNAFVNNSIDEIRYCRSLKK